MTFESLKEKYNFESWSTLNNQEQKLFIWKFFLSGNEIEDWSIYRNQNFDSDSGIHTIISSWENLQFKRKDRMLRLEIYQCNNLHESRETMLSCLANFESPQIIRLENKTIGEISFGTDGNDHFTLFIYANLVVVLSSCGTELFPVTDLAKRIDNYLSKDRGDDKSKVNPTIEKFLSRDSEITVGSSVQLDIGASDPLDRPLWYKFESHIGEVELIDGYPQYKALKSGVDSITLTVVNENNGSTSQKIQIEVK